MVWQNGGMMERWNGGKFPKILKEGIEEWWYGMVQNHGKSAEIVKDRMTENLLKS